MGKKRIVKEVDFTKEGSHIAICNSPANGEEVLIMKNKKGEDVDGKETEIKKVSAEAGGDSEEEKKEEVRITTSMATFLTRFFKLYHEDANELAELLGYEPVEWMWSCCGEDTTVEILKSYTDKTSISEEMFKNIKKMEDDFINLEKKKKEKDMKLEEALEELKKTNDTLADLKKSLGIEKAKREELEKAAQKKEQDDLVDLCKSYSFVGDDAEKLAGALFLCKNVEGFSVIMDTLEKARTALKTALEKEIGVDETKDLTKNADVPAYVSKVSELIKKRKEENK